MPKFFFDFQDNNILHADDEGSNHSSFQHARVEAVRSLLEVMRDHVSDGEHHNFITTVRGKNGVPLYRASLIFHGEHLT